jgi:hypothetical protein
MDEAITKAREAHGRHTFGHTAEIGISPNSGEPLDSTERAGVAGATRRDRTGDLLITNRARRHFH